MRWLFTTVLGVALSAWVGGSADDTKPAPATSAAGNLVRNPQFTAAGADPKLPADYTLAGTATWAYVGARDEVAIPGVALHPGKGSAASVAQDVALSAGSGRWFRFSFRGLPESHFAAAGLTMKVDFFGGKDGKSLDGVSRALDPLIERDRHDLAVNGDGKKNGAAVWKTYALEFHL